MPPVPIACIGEAMVELSLDQADPSAARIGFAGDTLNTAIYLKRAGGAALDVSYISVLGADPFSARLRALVAGEGISADGMGTSPDKLPGIYSITTDAAGERSFHYWRENSAARNLFQPGSGTSLDDLSRHSVVYLSAITLAILPPAIRDALMDRLAILRRENGLRVAFDSNWRPRLWSDIPEARSAISRAWSLADVALPSLDDEMALFGDADEASVLSRLNKLIPGDGALKRGGNGPVPIKAIETGFSFTPIPNPVDTTAAGDSFNGAFLAAILRGKPLQEALLEGHAYASSVIMHRGAIIARDALPPLD